MFMRGMPMKPATNVLIGALKTSCGVPICWTSPSFMMDEPLSNLDAKLRNQMRAEIIKLRQRINTTFIYVTHDQTEAMTLGDRIVIMKDGEVQQIGTPQEVFNAPVNTFVAGFIGMPRMNMFGGELLKENGKYYVDVMGAKILLSEDKQARLAAKNIEPRPVSVGARPEHISLDHVDGAMMEGVVEVSEMMGSSVHLHLNAYGRDCIIIVPTLDLENATFDIGSKVEFTLAPNAIHLFDPETGKNLEY
ncbi:MAG: TOBE domain-containing protein [Solobacterium sp.]|nr:TOBE domain-containing protein [Solobacterium sp.]